MSISSKIGFQIFHTSFTLYQAFSRVLKSKVEVVDLPFVAVIQIIFQLYFSKNISAFEISFSLKGRIFLLYGLIQGLLKIKSKFQRFSKYFSHKILLTFSFISIFLSQSKIVILSGFTHNFNKNFRLDFPSSQKPKIAIFLFLNFSCIVFLLKIFICNYNFLLKISKKNFDFFNFLYKISLNYINNNKKIC
jgi:hypothetical protein